MNFLIFFIFLTLSECLCAQTGFDTNDVSIFFPLKNGKPLPSINLETDKLISKKIFEQILSFEKNSLTEKYVDSIFYNDMSKWSVTSFRYEPCGDSFESKRIVDNSTGENIFSISKKQICQARIRLVVQPFNDFNPLPTAMHIMFNLSSEQGALFTDSLLALKKFGESTYNVSTNGSPLVIHPILNLEKNETNLEPFTKMLKQLLLKYISPLASTNSITLTIKVAPNHWKFVGGYVQNGEWTRFVTDFSKQFFNDPNKKIPMGVEELKCSTFSICFFEPLFKPAVLNPMGYTLSDLFQNNPSSISEQVPNNRSELTHIRAEQIDDTKISHFFNTSCISCHESSSLRDNTRLYNQAHSPIGITPFVGKKFRNDLTNNVINFGYWGSNPRISTRTAAESVQVANELNTQLGLKNPNNDINDISTFWVCVSSEIDFKKCL